jgi:hypothetical protein
MWELDQVASAAMIAVANNSRIKAAVRELPKWRDKAAMAEQRLSMRSGLAVDGRRVRYIEDGPRNGPDALLLAAAKLETLADTWPAMIEASRVVAIEFPGRGPSSEGTGLLQPFEMAPFVLRIIDRFRLRHPHS